MESYALLIAATLNAGTVLALASLGLLINEKAGIVNLGAEGMMLCAAIAGFATVVHSGSDALGLGAGFAAGALLALIFGLLVIWLNTNQYATGLALSLFGAGFSAFVGVSYVQEKMPERPSFALPGLADIPLVGPALFRHHPLVYLTIALALGLIWFLYRTRAGLVLRSVAGGFLAQARDNAVVDDMTLKVVTKRAPSERELADLRFAFRVAKHVKSNAIVYAKDGATVGIGAGQMSRVDSSRIAAWKAGEAARNAGLSESLAKGSVVASDAFFPFADGLLAAAEAGATAVIQPGGSMRDDEVIKAADDAGLAMVMTGFRHFRH